MQDESKKSSEPEQRDQGRHSRLTPWFQRLMDSGYFKTYIQETWSLASEETESVSLRKPLYSSTAPVTSSESTTKPSSRMPNTNG